MTGERAAGREYNPVKKRLKSAQKELQLNQSENILR